MTEPVDEGTQLWDVWIATAEHSCDVCEQMHNCVWPHGSAHPRPPVHPFCGCVIEVTDVLSGVHRPGPQQLPTRRKKGQGSMAHELAVWSEPVGAELFVIDARGDRLAVDGEMRRVLRERLAAGELADLEFEAVTFRAEYPNRNFVRFRESDLVAFAASFAGQPFLRDHDLDHIEARGGTVRASALAGREFVQRIALTVPRDVEAFVNGQIDRFSISWFYTGIICSVCGQDWLGRECTHWPGRYYPVGKGTVLCELIFEGPRGREVSAVNAPAVEGTGVRRVVAGLGKLVSFKAELRAQREQTGGCHMEEGQVVERTADKTADLEAVRVELEAARVEAEALLRVQRDAVLEARLAQSGLPGAFQTAIRESLADGWTVAELDALIERQRGVWAALEAEQTVRGHGWPRDGRLSGMRDARDELQDAMDWLFGVNGAPLPVPSLRRVDELYQVLTGDDSWYGKFNPERAKLASANSTTLADMATNAMNRVIIQAFADAQVYRWYERLVVVQPNDGSTQSMQWISYGGSGDLPTVVEGATYMEGSIGDSRETSAFVKRGKYVGITLEMMRRSDIAKMRAIPRALALDALRTRSAAVAAIFTANSGTGPVLVDDNTPLFHSSHGPNVASTALGTTLAAWTAARTECAKHTELGSGKRLGLFPKYLLVPIDLYDQALVLFSSEHYPGTANNDRSPLFAEGNAARPEVVMVPDWTDTNDWAYLVDPKLWPVIQMSYAQAPGGGEHPAPELFSVASETSGLVFTSDTLPVKVRDWFALGVSTWRGIGKRNVT